jgi:hypothetical protein
MATTIANTPLAGVPSRARLRPRAVAVVLAAALAVASLTVTVVLVVWDGGSTTKEASPAPVRVLPSAPQSQYLGGPGDVPRNSIGGPQSQVGGPTGEVPKGSPNDGSQHSGARP